jgi:hypothetical protein
MGRHQGEVKEVWGEWLMHKGLPPLSKSFHHCQYATTDKQRATMDLCGCRGRKLNKYEKVDWEAADDLTLEQLLAIGSTSICGGVSSISAKRQGHHWRRRAYVVTYNRLLCSLLGQQKIGMYEAEAWWNNARSICAHKDRQGRIEGGAKGQGPKGRGKGQPKGKHQPGGKGQCGGKGEGNFKGRGKGQPKGKHQPGGKGQHGKKARARQS